jgi:pyrroline-5-carboxylate reductase
MTMTENSNLAFIGAGNMATSLIGGLIGDGADPGRITVADPDENQLRRMREHFSVRTTTDNGALIGDGDAVVLCVKPHIIKTVSLQIAAQIQLRNPLVISIAAGIREADLRAWLGGSAAIVRAMPNTPALVQGGATALYANASVSGVQHDLAESILRAVGLTVWITEEDQMDAVTALSGSGPAYFFLLMEALQDAGVQLGLTEETARLLTLQTAFGAAKMALESTEDPSELRKRVTSPGGTTERALHVFEQAGLTDVVLRALQAAHDRSRELASQFGER